MLTQFLGEFMENDRMIAYLKMFKETVIGFKKFELKTISRYNNQHVDTLIYISSKEEKR